MGQVRLRIMTAFLRPLCAALIISGVFATAPAIAQSVDENSRAWIVTVGGGGYFAPKFPGAKDLELRPFPLFDLRRIGTDPVFETPDEAFGPTLIKGKGFSLGPALQFHSGRDEEDAIIGIGDVKTTVELGAFAEAYLSDNFRARGEIRKGLGGHKGLVADLGADMILGSMTDAAHFSIGPRLKLADARYMRAFYGVNAAQRAATGLALHDPDGGLHSAGALASANYRFNAAWGMEAYGRYDRLVSDAADSPLVRSAVGSRNQFEAGLGLTYSFRM